MDELQAESGLKTGSRTAPADAFLQRQVQAAAEAQRF